MKIPFTHKIFTLFFLFPLVCQVNAQGRQKITLNHGWEFSKDSMHWEKVLLPHTWNTSDPFDDEPGYYRGVGHYSRQLDAVEGEGRVFLFFEAVNQVARLYVNESFVGEHLGGYTAFAFDITDFLTGEENSVRLWVNNAHDKCIAPLKGDFNFYGGIYRDVYLIRTGSVHFDLSEGASGVFITPVIEEGTASLYVEAQVVHHQSQDAIITHKVFDQKGLEIGAASNQLSKSIGREEMMMEMQFPQSPRRWNIQDPYTYTLVSTITDRWGNVLDRVVNPFGFRRFDFNAKSGFYLNGENIKLVGVNRHQDYPGLGNALGNERHVKDMEIIREMGANFYRTAHYPQDPEILHACDRLGMVVSMEIPLDHELTDDPCFYASSKRMMHEMIRQYYNHPSIALWAYMNEMYLWKDLKKDSAFIADVREFAIVLDSLTRAIDSTRYTMIPNHGYFEVYDQGGLLDIPQVIGWNLYYGWYVENCEGFGEFLDHFHKKYPDKPVLVTEYGAGSDRRLHSFNPVRFDFSMEWQLDFHHCHIRQILERPYIAGSAVWNMYDFGSESRADAVPNINSKGLLNFDRTPKDGYYLYKAILSDKPFIEFGPVGWEIRKLLYKDRIVPAWIFTNAGVAHLSHNGRPLGSKQAEYGLIEFEVELVEGQNRLKAITVVDSQKVEKVTDWYVEFVDSPGRSFPGKLNLNLGGNFYFLDEISEETWIPVPEEKDSLGWGLIGGENYHPRNAGVGTDRGIALTPQDPIYQTAVEGVEKILLPLTSGQYAIEMHFSEIKRAGEKREFNILINANTWMEKVQLDQENLFRAKILTGEYYHNGGLLELQFESREGKALLNGLSIRKRW